MQTHIQDKDRKITNTVPITRTDKQPEDKQPEDKQPHKTFAKS